MESIFKEKWIDLKKNARLQVCRWYMAMAKIVIVANKSLQWGHYSLERARGWKLYCREGQCSERREVREAKEVLRELRAAGAIFFLIQIYFIWNKQICVHSSIGHLETKLLLDCITEQKRSWSTNNLLLWHVYADR